MPSDGPFATWTGVVVVSRGHDVSGHARTDPLAGSAREHITAPPLPASRWPDAARYPAFARVAKRRVPSPDRHGRVQEFHDSDNRQLTTRTMHPGPADARAGRASGQG